MLDLRQSNATVVAKAAFGFPWLPETLLLAIGLAVRAALYFPLAVFPLDSDGVLAGLCAFRVAQGHPTAFFPGGTRLSSASCYLTAAFSHIVGTGRLSLALTGLTWGALYLLFTLLFLKTVLNRGPALLSFLFAVVPSEQFVTITYIPWGYGEIAAACAAILWLGTRWRTGASRWQPFYFGISVGLGIWTSLQTLMIAISVLAWVVLDRRRKILSDAVPLLIGIFVGALPFLIANLLSGFPSLSHNWASRPANSVAQIWDNLRWLFAYPLPGLLVHGFAPFWSTSTILIVAYVLAGLGLFIESRRPNGGVAAPIRLQGLLTLMGLVVFTCIALFVLSHAGSMRGWTTRYILPLYAIVPVFLGAGLLGIARQSRWLAAVAVAATLAANLSLYTFPGTQARAYYTMWLAADAQLRDLFAQRGIQMVYGDYFSVYHLNFDTAGRVAAVPAYDRADYLAFGPSLGTSPVRWAMMGGLNDLREWANDAGATGKLVKVADTWVFIADHPAPDAAALLSRLQARCHIGSCTAPFPN